MTILTHTDDGDVEATLARDRAVIFEGRRLRIVRIGRDQVDAIWSEADAAQKGAR